MILLRSILALCVRNKKRLGLSTAGLLAAGILTGVVAGAIAPAPSTSTLAAAASSGPEQPVAKNSPDTKQDIQAATTQEPPAPIANSAAAKPQTATAATPQASPQKPSPLASDPAQNQHRTPDEFYHSYSLLLSSGKIKPLLGNTLHRHFSINKMPGHTAPISSSVATATPEYITCGINYGNSLLGMTFAEFVPEGTYICTITATDGKTPKSADFSVRHPGGSTAGQWAFID